MFAEGIKQDWSRLDIADQQYQKSFYKLFDFSILLTIFLSPVLYLTSPSSGL